MGNSLPFCCKYFNAYESDMKSSVVFTQIITITRQKETHYTDSSHYDVSQVLKIQSVWRGFIQRKHYAFLRNLSYSSSFFPQMDLFETLSNSMIDGSSHRKYKYVSGSSYKGDWLGGFRHGQGRAKWPDGSQYIGSWEFGYPYGQGTFTHSNQETFTGRWVNPYSTTKNHSDKDKNGFGKFYLVWLSSQPQLNKIKSSTYSNKLAILDKDMQAIFKSLEELKAGFLKLETQREATEIDNVVYKGEVIDGMRSGFGRSVWGNGDVYTGGYKENLQHGVGENLWIDGSRYFGWYAEGNKEGVGEYFWEDGSSYKGNWKNNLAHGIGEHCWTDGRSYRGQWEGGLMHGFGAFSWGNGSKYVGGWEKGKKNGVGYSVSIDGSESKDYWENGRIVKIG